MLFLLSPVAGVYKKELPLRVVLKEKENRHERTTDRRNPAEDAEPSEQ